MKVIKNMFWGLSLLAFVGVIQWDPTSEYDFGNQIAIVMTFVSLAIGCEIGYIKEKKEINNSVVKDTQK